MQQVDLRQANFTLPELRLFSLVLILSLARELVGQAEILDDGHDPLAGTRINDLNVSFRDRLGSVVNSHGFGDGDSGLGRSARQAAARIFHDSNVRIPRLVQGFARFQDDTLLHPGVQVLGQLVLQLVAGVNDQPGMHVAPGLFQVRIHSRKGTFHGLFSLVKIQ